MSTVADLPARIMLRQPLCLTYVHCFGLAKNSHILPVWESIFPVANLMCLMQTWLTSRCISWRWAERMNNGDEQIAWRATISIYVKIAACYGKSFTTSTITLFSPWEVLTHTVSIGLPSPSKSLRYRIFLLLKSSFNKVVINFCYFLGIKKFNRAYMRCWPINIIKVELIPSGNMLRLRLNRWCIEAVSPSILFYVISTFCKFHFHIRDNVTKYSSLQLYPAT